MNPLLLLADVNPADAAWARWLQDVMTSWPGQLVILLLFAGLALLLARHAAREWEGGLRNKYLLAGFGGGGIFFTLQFLFASSLVGNVSWPVWPFVIELVVLFALWLYTFVRFMTSQRSGPGDKESRDRGAALDRVIQEVSDEDGAATRPPTAPPRTSPDAADLVEATSVRNQPTWRDDAGGRVGPPW
jgi:hypothetical protein